ncbi:14-3-3 protein 9, partial [Tanacetum coccineum]
KGDYYMYLAEFKSGSVKKEAANQSLKAYHMIEISNVISALPYDRYWF